MSEVDRIIEELNLKPHPTEGGYFVETYRSEDVLRGEALPSRYRSDRNCCTAIYYLLKPGTFSEMHRLPTDEIFHFYLGDPVTMLQLFPDGGSKTITLGSDILAGQKPQVVVPKNVWQGTRLDEGGEFALLGCTVSPGFDFEDYESGERGALQSEYPSQSELIESLTHPTDSGD